MEDIVEKAPPQRFLTRHGRRTAALWSVGPFVVVALELCGQDLWLAWFLFALGIAGPIVYVASERALASRSRCRHPL